jgi:uncharacterized membrane protein YkoI
MTRRRTTFIVAAVAAAALAGAGVAIAGGDDDGRERPISGSALERAKAAALAHTPGRVTETEVGDEEGYYEVEVTRADGSQVDVHLDRDFAVSGAEGDSEEED